MSRGILLLLNLIPSVQSLFVKSFCGRKHFIRISERQITSFLQYVCVWLHQTDKIKQKTKIIRTQSNFTFPRKWSESGAGLYKISSKDPQNITWKEWHSGFHLEPIGNMAKKKKTHTELEMKNCHG